MREQAREEEGRWMSMATMEATTYYESNDDERARGRDLQSDDGFPRDVARAWEQADVKKNTAKGNSGTMADERRHSPSSEVGRLEDVKSFAAIRWCEDVQIRKFGGVKALGRWC